jgi:hypothetical protein
MIEWDKPSMILPSSHVLLSQATAAQIKTVYQRQDEEPINDKNYGADQADQNVQQGIRPT